MGALFSRGTSSGNTEVTQQHGSSQSRNDLAASPSVRKQSRETRQADENQGPLAKQEEFKSQMNTAIALGLKVDPVEPKVGEGRRQRLESSNKDLDELMNFFTQAAVELIITKIKNSHQGIKCRGCNLKSFSGHRFSCLLCEGYDVCGDCYEDRKVSGSHTNSHPMACFKSPRGYPPALREFGTKGITKLDDAAKLVNGSHNIKCQVCANVIQGIRLKCSICIDFDICYNCFKKEKNHIESHQFIAHFHPIQNRFKKEEIRLSENALGQGCFGTVVPGRLQGDKVAVKMITYYIDDDGPDKELHEALKTFLNECKLSQECCSNYIVTCYGSYEAIGFTKDERPGRDGKQVYKGLHLIFYEYMEEGTLYDLLHGKWKDKGKRLSLRRKFSYILCLARGIAHLHSKNIVHKDLKPDNLFIDGTDLKIGDFGISKVIENNQSGNEIISRMYYLDENMTLASDIFCFGLVINEIFTREMADPYEGGILRRANSCYFYGVIKACTLRDQTKRPTIESVKEYLKKFNDHFWKNFGNYNYNPLSSTEQKDEVFDTIYKKFIEENGEFPCVDDDAGELEHHIDDADLKRVGYLQGKSPCM